MCTSPGAKLFLSALAFFAPAAFSQCAQSNLTTGTQTSGAAYVLYMPEKGCWNGNMVVFAHGYVAPGASPGVPQDQLSIGGVSLPTTFNQLGYGFAASGYSKNGLAIKEGVDDTRDLVLNVLPKQKLAPGRVYLIGASEGGLVTALSAEQLPYVYDAAGAACGPIGSFQSQINYLGDFRVVFDYFFPGVLPGSPVDIPSDVMAKWNTFYIPTIEAALAANPGATKQLLSVTKAAATSDPTTVAETVLGVLWYNVFATNDAGVTLGGQPFDNHNRFYSGSTNDLLLNLKVQRFTADRNATSAIAANYETTGKLRMPTVTIHTTGDPIVPYWHEPLYTLKTLGAGSFLERINLPIASYGHCSFTGGEVLAAFAIMVLRDTGLNLSPSIQSLLPDAARTVFQAVARENGLSQE